MVFYAVTLSLVSLTCNDDYDDDDDGSARETYTSASSGGRLVADVLCRAVLCYVRSL
jgi:hypothetical protein